jgi:hypothetical protein
MILLWLLVMVILIPIVLLFVFAFVVLGVIFSAAASAGAEILSILVGVLTVFVFVLVIMVPIIAIMVYLGFYPYANSLRHQGPLGALRYSKNVVSGQALHVFGYELGIGILSAIVTFCVTAFALMGGVFIALIPDLTIPIKVTMIFVQVIGSIIGALFTSMLIVLFLNLDYLRHPAAAAAVLQPAPIGPATAVAAAPVVASTPVEPVEGAAAVADAPAQPPASDAAVANELAQPSGDEPPAPDAAA